MSTHLATATDSWVAQATIDSPLGPMLLAATDRGLAGVWFESQQHHPDASDAPTQPGHPHLAQAARELAQYFKGQRQHFEVPLDPQGTPFQQRVWSALRRIAPGSTSTYSDVARSAGHADAVRAAGAAIGRNPISVIVPCHRVIGRDGSLTGYAGGLERKRALLELESKAAP
jgi:methylated-DNA-[protein]-cysteine S-methyltransferase